MWPMIELENKSCFDYLKEVESNSIDLILIDPPYEISRDTNFKRGATVERLAISMDFGDWDKDFKDLDVVIKESYRVLKKSGTLICFYDLWKITTLSEYFKDAKFTQLRFIEWVKTNPVPINSKHNYLTNSREIAVVGIKGGSCTFNSEYDSGIYSYPICQDEGRFHPTQKPLALIKEIVAKHSNENDTVLDCFSGSGTTAAACLELNRNFKGCEINKDYFNKSVDRLNDMGTFRKNYVFLERTE